MEVKRQVGVGDDGGVRVGFVDHLMRRSTGSLFVQGVAVAAAAALEAQD